MKKLISLFFLLAVAAHAAQPIAVQKDPTTLNLTGDIKVLAGRTITIGTGGQLVISGGTLDLGPGTVTASSISLATGTVLGRSLAGSGAATTLTPSQVLDIMGTTRGAVLYRGASGWALLPPGTSGYVLTSNGTGADVAWATAGVGSGTVTSIPDGSTNGVTWTVATRTSTPTFTFSLGVIAPTSVNSVVLSGSSSPTLAVTGTTTVSGANTGDQTSVTGNAGTATALQNSRQINGVGFDGTTNITVTAAAGTLTGGTLASGVTASSLTSAAGGTFGTAAFQASGAFQAASAVLSALAGGSAFVTLTGPSGTIKSFALPNASATILTTNAPVTVPQGGTGLATGTAGGVMWFTGSGTTAASSAELTASQLVVGGGSGAAPAALGTLGTTTTVLHGNAGGLPTFGAVHLVNDVTGTATVPNGGSGLATTTAYSVVFSGTTATGNWNASIGPGTAGNHLISSGAGAYPVWAATNLAGGTAYVSGALPTLNGGLGGDASTASGVPLFASGTNTFTGTSGTGNFARVSSPTFVAPILGAATGTSFNGNFFTTGSSTYTGTAGQTYTFPTTTATIARIDAANAFVGASTASAWVLTSPTVTTKISPTSDDGAPLGDTTHNFSDLFLASGAVVNFANSNVVLTHTSGVLTLGTGNLIVTTAGTAAGSVLTTTGTQTISSKRYTTRITSISSSATPTVNTDSCDEVDITALAAAITSMTTNLTGTPAAGDILVYDILAASADRAITWGASFEAGLVALPTTATNGKHLIAVFKWIAADSKWFCLSAASQL